MITSGRQRSKKQLTATINIDMVYIISQLHFFRHAYSRGGKLKKIVKKKIAHGIYVNSFVVNCILGVLFLKNVRSSIDDIRIIFKTFHLIFIKRKYK